MINRRISVSSRQQTADCSLFTILTEIKLIFFIGYVQGKGKAIPVQAWTGLEVSRSLGLPYLKTFGT